jgi:hypothetical protein
MLPIRNEPQLHLTLWRLRQLSFMVMLISLLVFISAFFALYVGIPAGLLAFLSGFITFQRAESKELLLYGIVPCVGALCACTPDLELDAAGAAFVIAALLGAASCVVSIVAAFVGDPADWLVALRILCAFFSFLLAATLLTALGTLRLALRIIEDERRTALPPTFDPQWSDPYHVPPPNFHESPPHPQRWGVAPQPRPQRWDHPQRLDSLYR